MIAYKGTRDMRCRDLRYEVGKTYIFKGDLQPCQRGFHACSDITDVHRYYSLNSPDTVVLEVEVPDDAVIIKKKNSEDSKFVTNKIKIRYILTKNDIERISNGSIRFDENGRLEYIRFSNGYWERRRYDDRGNEVYYENSSEYWRKTQYDRNGNEIYCEDSSGYWRKIQYDENGNEIYYEDSDGYWYRKQYDENGNKIYYENSAGQWIKRKFDENGNMIYYEDWDGVKYEIEIV